ncbi:MAG: cell wall-binding protein [Streptococcus salivarius]|jgi:glucosyltransferase-I|uniref:hypothetical protein n=1 Tax=Streptococcus salivarius TaxID=1304 RepID=UPI0009D6D94C|nr:hypothetical protein [Streptococcus salivarius]MDU5765549.1 cell wall-binding protein [Streptococcus salivarius]
MKVHSNFAGQTSKHRLLALSCATALAGFAFIAKPALAEEATADNTANLDTRATTTANVETTADLVETKVIDATPATEATANTSEEAASVNTDAATTLTKVTVSQEQTPDQPAVATNAVEAQATNTESNTSTGHYYSDDKGNWYYKDANGENLKGAQTIDGQNVYFRDNGQQVKGGLAKPNGFLDRYYDVDSGDLWTNRYVEFNGNWYYLGNDGKPVTGAQTINGQEVFFHRYHGFQIKGDFAGYYSEVSTDGNYYDGQTGDKVTHKGFVQRKLGDWFYLDDKGDKVMGLQTIDGKLYYFTASGASKYIQYGKQVKGEAISFVNNSKYAPVYGVGTNDKVTQRYYFDENTGEAVKNRYIYLQGDWYYFGDDGNAIRPESGEAVIDDQVVYLYKSGKQAKGELIEVNGVPHYYDANSGARVSNAILTIKGKTYQFDADGNGKLIG